MQQQQGLETTRTLNNNRAIEVEHDMSERTHIHQDNNHQSHSHSHIDEDHSHHNHSHEGHSHGDNCGHDHAHGSHSNNSQKPRKPKKNYGIMIYIILSVLGCFYLMTQHFNPLIDDYFSRIHTYFISFMIGMILWSYIQTHRIGSQVPKMSKFMNHDTIGGQLVDSKYLLTARHCQKCNYYKLPRVSHCSTCGECIYKLDHHCMWTQTCIGHCNQRPFIWFCIYMTFGVMQFWITSVRAVIFMVWDLDQGFFTVFQPGVYVLWMISCFSAAALGYMVVQLVISHILMICVNGTTLDSMKRKAPFPLPFIEFRPVFFRDELINTFDRGQIQNLRSLFGTNILTFWLPFGRQIEHEFIIEPMNPQPTKMKLMKQTTLFDPQMDIQNQRYLACLNVKQTYKGQTFILDGQEITV